MYTYYKINTEYSMKVLVQRPRCLYVWFYKFIQVRHFKSNISRLYYYFVVDLPLSTTILFVVVMSIFKFCFVLFFFQGSLTLDTEKVTTKQNKTITMSKSRTLSSNPSLCKSRSEYTKEPSRLLRYCEI